MLVSTSRLLRSRPPCLARHFARTITSYSPKVRALPFVLSPAEAKSRASAVASLFCVEDAYTKTLLRGLGGWLFPWLCDPHPPKRVQAVYIPAWFVDVEVGAKTWLSSRGDSNTAETFTRAHLYRSYMPGFSQDPLSRLSFSSAGSDDVLDLAVPFTADLAKQHDTDIVCPPYTLTPFSIGDKIRSMSLKDAVIEEDFRFDPTSVTEEIVAAYPVLIPVYLLQYEIPLIKEEYTIMIDASSAKGQMIIENPVPMIVARSQSPESWSWVPDDLLALEFGTLYPWDVRHEPFAKITYLGVPGTDASVRMYARALGAWVDGHATPRGAMKQYEKYEQSRKSVGKKAGNFADLRVRPFEKADSHAAEVYMLAARAVYSHEVMVKKLDTLRKTTSSDNVRVYTIGKSGEDPPDPMAEFDRALEALQGQLTTLEEFKEKYKPAWLKEWYAQQKPTGKGQ